ncbi:DUF3040 domain-containing protein [Demequina aestuarii]|uniref:DUF3040 domain-containing protein n=1 Tax=Demequina aestuarii TaxID=327095 RepID=UPI000786070F|nr:DUF3040 domain-containing protein [Demequina aestuarii]
MPLSEYEQRVLEQLEQDLGQDASLHRAMNRGPRTPVRVIGAAVGVLVGLGIVLVGVMTQVALLGIAGFILMAGVALWALLGPRKSAEPGAKATAGPAGAKGKAAPPKASKDFMQRMEERFDRRREQGEL